MALLGTDLLAIDFKGVDIGSIELHGTTSDSGVQAHELTGGPGLSTGSGNYISVAGASAAGHYGVAHLLDVAGNPAEDLDLYIADERRDPMSNLLHSAASQDNEDVWLYTVYFFNQSSGQWVSLCPVHALTGAASAIALPEDPANPNKFIFACTATGVAAKCAHVWGFRPWRSAEHTFVFSDVVNDWVDQTYDMRPFYDACKVAARAAYCQDRQSFTKNGTQVDLFDTRQFVWPNAIENPFNALNFDSRWMFAQEYFVAVDPMGGPPGLKATALQRPRYRDLSPIGACADFSSIDRLEEDHFEDGRWANPLTNTPRIEVFSPNYCTHNETVPGEGLPWDCSPCTTRVCRTHPQCCSLNSPGAWTAACVAEAASVCPGPPGLVWPQDLPPGPPATQKYLLSPGGAVDRVDGVSTATTAATVSGWACDPEWPGGAVTVAFYGGAPREQPGSVPLGQVYADQPLALPLAREVSAACEAPNLSSARHGFSFTLPTGTTGSVFAYALDPISDPIVAPGHPDPPPAPPTLLRNGIVAVPAAPVARPAFAQVTTGWIEAPVSGTYTFEAALQPSRLFVNGQKLLDWFGGAGSTQGSITLQQGSKYHLRWDRFQAAPPVPGSGPGLSWQPPGAAVQVPVPAASLYRIAPGSGQGLQAQYFPGTGFAGAPVPRLDATVDVSTTNPPPAPVPPASYSAIWDGEIVPLFSDSYTFSVTTAGTATLNVDGQDLLPPEVIGPPLTSCPHDICVLGEKLTASTTLAPACDTCVDKICAQDPFCCNGDYLSYYTTEQVWDAKCISEVATACGLTCPNPIPTPTTRQRKGEPIALQAGVHYRIQLRVDNGSGDPTVQLEWASPRQNKQVVPTFALFAPVAPAGAGAGVNVTVFGTKMSGGQLQPDLDTPLAAGAAADLSIEPTLDSVGLPQIDVLAVPSDPVTALPPAPAVVTPTFKGQVFSSTLQVPIAGMGGVRGGAVRVEVDGTPITALLPVGPDGRFSGLVSVPSYASWTLLFSQRTYAGAACTVPPDVVCAESAQIKWPVTVSPTAPVTPPPPVITAPRDPTASPDPTHDTFAVTGSATPGLVNICDLGGIGNAGLVSGTTTTAGPDGKVNDVVKLTAGSTSNPNAGWHKLVFNTASGCTGPGVSKPVFVSVGIRPPTVEFPRSGAKIDCGNPQPGIIHTRGTIPYSVDQFGPLRILEETGVAALAPTRSVITSLQALPEGGAAFEAEVSLQPGKHLIYFFQAPNPPPEANTPEAAAAHFRAFSSIANTPKSRIEIDVPPVPLALPAIPGTTAPPRVFVTAPSFKFGPQNCAQVFDASCAQARADVNVHIDGRTWTGRADDFGNWDIGIDLTPGWHELRVGQVVDSPAGGGWVESCPSPTLPVGVTTGASGTQPTLTLPFGISRDATSAAGAQVFYTATAATATGTAIIPDCAPASGATFHLGQTDVLCTAVDPDTHVVGVGTFVVTIVDGPPVVHVPAGGITAEAQSALGALVSYDVTADDAVSGPLPVTCVPSAPPGSPVLFPLDLDQTVTCQATDGAGHTASASFVVRVRDTTPPVLCDLPDVRVEATGPAGARVTYATCASDLVDGAVPVTCDHPSGSMFAVGDTLVTCTATDAHNNSSPAGRFTVTVGDTTPPVLHLPATIDAAATSRFGVRVSYSATATDNFDPAPQVVCAPASGALFALGSTTVLCTATDASGNQSQGSFVVRVTVGWSNLLPPIDPGGQSVFLHGPPLLVRFALTGASARVSDLIARLFIAPISPLGAVGTEEPAIGIPPALVGNQFVFVPVVNEYALTLQTARMARGAWQLRVDLGDGVRHTVRITLR